MPRTMTMSSKRAWHILRMALLWGRKGGVLKRRLLMELRVVPKFLKNHLRHHNTSLRDRIHYGERQLSFDDTPIFHVKMHRPSLRFTIPCISPQVDFDYDFDDNDDDLYAYDSGRKSFLEESQHVCDQQSELPSEEIDLKAEEFIAKFYQQMKMQRQISYLQYTDT